MFEEWAFAVIVAMSDSYPDFFEVAVSDDVQPVSTHKVTHDAGKTWEDEPGNLFARIYFGREDELLDALFANMPASMVENLRHKISAIRYHKERYLGFERRAQQNLLNASPALGAEVTWNDPEAVYDLEAFLFQIKSCLDVAMLLLNRKFRDNGKNIVEGYNKSKIGNKEVAGEGTAKEIRKYLDRNTHDLRAHNLQLIIQLIKDSQLWTTELVSMRDKVTHSARLKALWFVQEVYNGGGICRVGFPRLPADVRDIRTAEYMEEAWNNILFFMRGYLEIIKIMPDENR